METFKHTGKQGDEVTDRHALGARCPPSAAGGRARFLCASVFSQKFILKQIPNSV